MAPRGKPRRSSSQPSSARGAMAREAPPQPVERLPLASRLGRLAARCMVLAEPPSTVDSRQFPPHPTQQSRPPVPHPLTGRKTCSVRGDSQRVSASRRPRRKGRALELAEYALIGVLLTLTRALPAWLLYGVAYPIAWLVFAVAGGRRRIAIGNVRHALGAAASKRKAAAIARASFRSFGLAVMPEIVKLRPLLTAPDARERILRRSPELEGIFARARSLHEQTGGCIFVTPHFGNWELFPYLATAFGIPLAVAVRPLDNGLLEELLARHRRGTGQQFVSRINALGALRLALVRGKSVGLLPDQSTRKGLTVEFFGRPAATTPVPALLAFGLGRPIVVVAAYRVGTLRFAGHLGEPIWPDGNGEERAEVLRLTAAMNQAMEEVIRRHPEQYFWMHNR
ncbi:MAG: lysophospholipid acyltransferase family protein, partial [Acidobacteriota bacterium]